MADRYAYLVFVDGLNNHNKYYEITQNQDMSIDVNYGRVGGSAMRHHYEPYEKTFDGLLRSKTSKGYDDVTSLHSVASISTQQNKAQEELNYQPIKNEEINELIEMLVKSAREFMQTHYTVKAAEITPKMVEEAQADIEQLTDIANNSQNAVWRFNEKLQELFTDIPRKMSDVSAYLAKTSADFTRIIDREQNMLDNIKGQIMPMQSIQAKRKDGTVLEAYGLDVQPITYKEEDQILSHLGRDYGGREVADRYVRSFKVENSDTREQYEQFKRDNGIRPREVRLFYHGSKVENWWSIMKQGLSLNPNASVTGKMFGNGLYFASECRKSLNYMDVAGSVWNSGRRESGYMAIYSVALGKCYKPSSSLHSRFGKDDLPNGCMSVYADKHLTGLKNDEYVVYRPEQCTIKYLVEMTKHDVREKVYHLDRKAVNLEAGLDTLTRIHGGVEAELKLENLPEKTAAEISEKIIKGYDADKVFMRYDINQDSLSFAVQDFQGKAEEITPYAATGDDMAFLCREMKKAFAESETEWKSLMEEARNIRCGKTVMSKSEDKSDRRKQKGAEKE